MDMDISMDIHAKSVDMDMDMDGKFLIHGNPDKNCKTVTVVTMSIFYCALPHIYNMQMSCD